MSLQSEMLVEQKVSNAQKSTGTAYLLWFFLGGFGAHRFYLGKTGTAVTQLIITLIGCFTLFPLIITGIWFPASSRAIRSRPAATPGWKLLRCR